MLNFAAAVFAGVATYAFFLISASVIVKNFASAAPPDLPFWVASACLVCVVAVGIVEFRRGAEHSEFHETDLYPGFDLASGSGYRANRWVQPVSATSFVLSQFFLAAPLQLMKGIERLRSRIPETAGLETELAALLAQIESNPKWHPMRPYADRSEALGYLVRMEKVLFSPNKGRVRPA